MCWGLLRRPTRYDRGMSDYRKLSTRDAGLLLGGISRSTMRRRAETGELPDGWRADKENRPQGEAWVIYVPNDDPRLGRLDASHPELGTSQDASVVPAVATPQGYRTLEEPYSEPHLSIADLRTVLIEPLVTRLAENDRQLAARYEMIGQLRETVARFQVLMEAADRTVAGLEAGLAVSDETVSKVKQDRDTAVAALAKTTERLREVEGEAGGLRLALKANAELADELRQMIAIEHDRRIRAEAALGWRRWRWVVKLLGPAT
jgi:hypothetical protein